LVFFSCVGNALSAYAILVVYEGKIFFSRPLLKISFSSMDVALNRNAFSSDSVAFV